MKAFAFVCILVYDSRQCIFQWLIEVLYEKKQRIMTYDAKFVYLQAQVEKLESASAEKDTCIAEYEAMVKGSGGDIF